MTKDEWIAFIIKELSEKPKQLYSNEPAFESAKQELIKCGIIGTYKKTYLLELLDEGYKVHRSELPYNEWMKKENTKGLHINTGNISNSQFLSHQSNLDINQDTSNTNSTKSNTSALEIWYWVLGIIATVLGIIGLISGWFHN